jgi:hypothetical protein
LSLALALRTRCALHHVKREVAAMGVARYSNPERPTLL